DSLVDVEGEFIPAFRYGQRNAFLYGGELIVDLHPHPLDWLHWENRFSYVLGKMDEAMEGVKYLPLIPAPRWVSEIRGEFTTNGKLLRDVSFHAEVDHTFNQDRAFTAFGTETPTPGYTLINAGISANIARKNRTLFSIYFNAMNIGDVAYQNHLSRLKYTAENPATGRMGVFNMGRNFSLKVNVPFAF
ncbi:MAG TPA: TonB-dependent receptor, partial [Flavisolibacter sp.]